MMRFLIAMTLLFSSLVVTAGRESRMPKVGKIQFRLIRNTTDLSRLPTIEATSHEGSNKMFNLVSTLKDSENRVVLKVHKKIEVPAGKTVQFTPFEPSIQKLINGNIYLGTFEVAPGATLSGIFGTPKPVDTSKSDIFGMNVHIHQFAPHNMWKLLQMLKKAGISSVRIDAHFCLPGSPEILRKEIDRLEEQVLAFEAFGIEPVVLIGYFFKEFHSSPEKLKLAREWMKELSASVKGRCSYQFGNETNSGWGAYGSAADMAALNIAFSIGVKESDPKAMCATFGIAEGFPIYVDKMFKNHINHYMDAITVHPYTGTPETSIAKCQAVRSTIAANGGSQQVWGTEVGYNVDKKGQLNPITGNLTAVNGYTLEAQGQLVPRLYIAGMSKKVDRIYLYSFYGKFDGETFWIVQPDFTPNPAYLSLVECASRLKGAKPLGGTDMDELVQKHYFRTAGGKLVLVTWALRDNVPAGFKLPKSVRIYDYLGKEKKLPESGELVLNSGLVYVEGIDPALIPGYINPLVQLTALDSRSFKVPQFRFSVNPGEEFEVPYSVLNSSKFQLNIKPVLKWSEPNWQITMPEKFTIPSGASMIKKVKIKVPQDAVAGVEYRFTFGGTLNELQTAAPYQIRVKVKGDFPYADIKNYYRKVDYPMWDSMREVSLRKGRETYYANNAPVKVDGKLNEWKPEEFYPLDQQLAWKLRDSGSPNYEDWNGKVALRWDDKYLYAAFLVEDNDLCMTDFVSRDWRECDNARLMLSSIGNPKKRTQRVTKKDMLLITTPTGTTHTEPPMVNICAFKGLLRPGYEKNIPIASKVWYNGYVMELAVPFEALDCKPEPEMKMGFNAMADDIDNGYREHVSMTYFKDLNYWYSPGSTATLILKK